MCECFVDGALRLKMRYESNRKYCCASVFGFHLRFWPASNQLSSPSEDRPFHPQTDTHERDEGLLGGIAEANRFNLAFYFIFFKIQIWSTDRLYTWQINNSENNTNHYYLCSWCSLCFHRNPGGRIGQVWVGFSQSAAAYDHLQGDREWKRGEECKVCEIRRQNTDRVNGFCHLVMQHGRDSGTRLFLL